MSTQLPPDTPTDTNLAVLKRVFKEQQIALLRDFLDDRRSSDESARSLGTDLWHLLHHCVVIAAANVPRLVLYNSMHVSSSLSDIVTRIIETTIRQGIKPRQRPIFTRGYYLGSSSTRIDSMVPNTMVNFIKTQPWKDLLMLIGEGHMVTLLTHTVLLYQLPNNCYMQVTGLPVSVSHYEPVTTRTYRHITPVLRKALKLPSRRAVAEMTRDQPDQSRADDTPTRARKSKSRRHVRHKRNKRQSVTESVAADVKVTPVTVPPREIKATPVTVPPPVTAPKSRKTLGTRIVVRRAVTPRDTEVTPVKETPATPVTVPPREAKVTPVTTAPAPPPPAPRKSPQPRTAPQSRASTAQSQPWVALDHHAVLYSNIHTRSRGLPQSHVLNAVTADLAGATKLARSIFNIPATRNLPSRVNNLLPLLTELIAAHKRCNYSALLEHNCPIPPRSRAPTSHVPVNSRKRARDEEQEIASPAPKRARVMSSASLLPPTPRQIKVQARLMLSPSPYMESFDLTQRTGTYATPQLSPRSSMPNHNLRLLLNSPGKSPLPRSPVKHVSPVKLHVSPVKHASQSDTPSKLYITQDFTPSATNTPLKTPLSAPLITQNSDILTASHRLTGTAEHVMDIEHVIEDISPATPVNQFSEPDLVPAEQLPPAIVTPAASARDSSQPAPKTRVKLSHVELSELLTYYSPDYQVTSFLISVLQHVVPAPIWGSKHNARVVFNFARRFVGLRRRETLNSRELLTGFKLNDCAWLHTESTAHKPPSDHVKRCHVLHQLLLWFMNELLVCLLRTNFYCTETAPHKHRIFYYRRPVWSRIHKLQMHHLLQRHMLRVLSQDEAKKVLQQRKLGSAIIRFLPKTDGLRPILNLGRRTVVKTTLTHSTEIKRTPSINDTLRNVFHVLTHEKNTSGADKFGASVFSHDDEYRKLVQFKRQLLQRYDQVLPQLYVVAIDISKSYDTIQQHKLYALVQQLFRQDEYLVQQMKRTQIKSNSATTRHQYIVHGAGLGSFPQFSKQALALAHSLRNAILSDVVNYDLEDTSALLQLLQQHIFHNVVQDGDKSYLQCEGIPQGSILSALLCSLYYGHLESTHLHVLPRTGGEGLLLRFIDDFLYLTPHKQHAIEFTQRMYQGYADYGCTVNKKKTLVNFELVIDGFLVPQVPTRTDGKSLMPWCGWLIDTRQLEIEGDYSRYQANYIGDSLTIDYTNKPGQKLKDKAIKYCQQKMHLLLLDANLNSESTVYINIYNAFMLCAIKMVRHTLSLRSMTAHNTDFVLELFLAIIDYMAFLIKSKASSSLGKEMNCRCEIEQNVINWLGFKSFLRVLNKKQTQFRVVIKALTLQLRSLRIERRKLDTLERAIRSESCIGFDYIIY